MGAENPIYDESISSITSPDGSPITPEEAGMSNENTIGTEEIISTSGKEYIPDAETLLGSEIQEAHDGGDINQAQYEMLRAQLESGVVSLKSIQKEFDAYIDIMLTEKFSNE